MILAMMAMMASCQQEELFNDTNTDKIPVNISLGLATKASDTAFETSDKVGVFMENSSSILYSNIANTYNGSSWSLAQEMYWPDQTTPASFFCYYPDNASATSLESYAFSVKTDQSTTANYKASDFIWGNKTNQSPTENAINVTANHLMSKVIITLVEGDGFSSGDLSAATLKLKNVKTGSAVNLRTGSLSASGSATEVTPLKNGTVFQALLIPQTIADGTELAIITVNGTDYSLKKGATFTSGKVHNFTINVNKTSSGLNIGIEDWGDGDDYEGDAE